ncbi:MAG: alpha/beta hydrolase, partial [Gammaproteobacteria bacterium]
MLLDWQHTTSTGLTLRGQHTPVTGKPVVHFVHGTGFNGRVYWPMLQQLLPQVDIVLTNAQGHGGSDTGER